MEFLKKHVVAMPKWNFRRNMSCKNGTLFSIMDLPILLSTQCTPLNENFKVVSCT